MEAAVRILGGKPGRQANDPKVRIVASVAETRWTEFVEYSVFELLTTQYDFEFGPEDCSETIRALASDPSRFVRVREELTQRCLHLPTKDALWRVRKQDGGHLWPPEAMMGNPQFPPARANLKGQCIIYLADSVETALAEVRANTGQTFTGAKLQAVRPLRLVDVRGQRAGGTSNPFATLDLWLSRPVSKNAPELEDAERHYYHVTQLFSCIVRDENFDGLVFSSSVREGGSNFALFSQSNVRVRSVVPSRFVGTDVRGCEAT